MKGNEFYLIEQKQIGIVQHSSSELKLHLPASRETSDNLILAFIIESDLTQLFADLGSGYVGECFI